MNQQQQNKSTQPKKQPTLNQKIFNRQLGIDCWKQQLLQQQVALLLGMGGLGTWVSISLCRLGIKKLILLDFDVVQISNLNRQVLYTHEDIGKSKSQQAKKRLINCHRIAQHTQIESYNFCALKNWPKVIKMASESTFVFNMIDHGDSFDAAVQSLCLKLNKPLILGGNYNQQLSVDAFFQSLGMPCYGCISDNVKEEDIQKITQDKILEIEDLSFIAKDDHPVGISNSYLAAMCANIMVAQFSTYVIADPEVQIKQRIIYCVNSSEMFGFADIGRDKSCKICGFQYVKEEVEVGKEKNEGQEEKKQEEQDVDKQEKKLQVDSGKVGEDIKAVDQASENIQSQQDVKNQQQQGNNKVQISQNNDIKQPPQ